MTWAMLAAFFVAFAAGTYLALSRDVLRTVVGLALMSSAVNLVLFASGRLTALQPAIVMPGATSLPTLITAAANPLPQALVLTAIVIGFALLCFALVLALSVIQRNGSDDSLDLRAVEPPSTHPVKPPLIEAEEHERTKGAPT